MLFKSFDNLRTFTIVASHLSITTTANVLSLTKGAVSSQILKLEDELGFALFTRQGRGLHLTDKGARLLAQCKTSFEDIEYQIGLLQRQDAKAITIGMTTYFASRWLSPRLMHFTSRYPQIGLRLQPTTGVVDLHKERIDMLIRWGDGKWNDLEIEPLFYSPVMPTAGRAIVSRAKIEEIGSLLSSSTLLHDYDGSKAWEDWHKAAGLPYRSKRDDLVITDPNVRVQAVIDGQGIALNDRLVDTEINAGNLATFSPVSLQNYGYFLAYPNGALENQALSKFRKWLLDETRAYTQSLPGATV